MLSLNNIHPLTDFKRNASAYIEQIRQTLSPLVLTVNGKAAVVVHDAAAFQAMLDHQTAMENELRELKRLALREDIQVGLDHLDQGQSTEYSDETLSELFDDIRQQGRAELGLAE